VKVEVCLFATLGCYLPPGASGDRVILEVLDRTTVGQVMASLHIPDDLDRLQVVNGHDAVPEHVLKDGDILSVFPPLAGGT
jgi:molybdopterin converting factor small subunit